MVIAIRAGTKEIAPSTATLSLSGVSDQTEFSATIPDDGRIAPADLDAPVYARYHGRDFHRWSTVDATQSRGGNAASYVAARFALGPQRGGTLWGSSIALLRSLKYMPALEQRIRPLIAFTESAEDDEIILAQTSHIATYIFLSAGAGAGGLNALYRLRDGTGGQAQRNRDLTPLRRAMSATLESARTYGDALAALYSEWGLICRPVYDWGDGDDAIPDLVPLEFAHALDAVADDAPLLAATSWSRPYIRRLATPVEVVAPFRYSSGRRCAPVAAGYVAGAQLTPVTTQDGATLHNVYTQAMTTGAALSRQILRPGQPRTPEMVARGGATLLEATSPDLWTCWAESERAQWKALLPHREATATVLGPSVVERIADYLPGTAIRINNAGSYWITQCRMTDAPPRFRVELELVQPL